MYHVIWLISHIVLWSELCNSKENLAQCFTCHLDTTFYISKLTSVICLSPPHPTTTSYCIYKFDPVIINQWKWWWYKNQETQFFRIGKQILEAWTCAFQEGHMRAVLLGSFLVGKCFTFYSHFQDSVSL